MGKYDFSALYSDATILDNEFLTNEFGYDINEIPEEIVFKVYYTWIINSVYRQNAFFPIASEIEEFLANGYCDRFPYVKSPITDENERKYLFLMAQAHQLEFDRKNGKSTMIKGESNGICEETKILLGRLGLIQPVRW